MSNLPRRGTLAVMLAAMMLAGATVPDEPPREHDDDPPPPPPPPRPPRPRPRFPPIAQSSGSYVATVGRPGDVDRIDAARAKRERKAAKRLADAAKKEAGRG